MASSDVDELFGQGDAPPRPRTAVISLWMYTGLTLAVFGLACTSVPGALLVLWAWSMLDAELARVDNGYLAPEARDELTALEWRMWAAIGALVMLLLFQATLLSNGFYEWLWETALRWILAGITPAAIAAP